MSIYLRKISDFEYYFGGKIIIRQTFHGGVDELINLDEEFINNKGKFHIEEFDMLVKLNCPVIKVHVHKKFMWLSDCNPYLEFNLEGIRENSYSPQYSQNGTVNFLLTLMINLKPKNLSILYDRYTGKPEVYFGRYGDTLKDDCYHLCVYSYNHYHIWCNVSGNTISKLELNKLRIMNWPKTKLYRFIQKDINELTNDEIKLLPYNAF